MPALSPKRLQLARAALKEGHQEPKNNPVWNQFHEERAENSALAYSDWPRFRQGLRRLERVYARRVPLIPLRLALAHDAFFCATHWRHSRSIVQPALDQLLRLPIGPVTFTFAVAEYWQWARYYSPQDLPEAEELLVLARGCLDRVDDWNRWNLTRMLQAVVEEHRPVSQGEP